MARSLAPLRAVGLVAVGAGLLVGVTHLTAPINVGPRTSSAVAPTPHADPISQTHLICPGPEALGVEGVPSSVPQKVSVAAASAPEGSLPSGFVAGPTPTGPGDGSLTLGDLASGGKWSAPVTARGKTAVGQVSTARSAVVDGVGALAPGTVATQWSLNVAGDSRGLVTSACIPAADTSWLIGGGAAPGRLEHLVLANPGPNPVTVDLSVLGAKGLVTSPNGQGLVVAGHGRSVILLDAISGSEPSPVVHVVSRGGKVAAFLSDTWLDGLVPRGGDDVVSMAPPAREQVIASVPVDGQAILRVGIPGDTEAVVQSRVLTPSGPKSLPADGVTRVAGGSTKDIDLSSLPPGAYAVQVRSDVPVVAAVMLDRRKSAGGPSDLAWSVASLPIKTLAGMALPATGITGLAQQVDLAATNGPASVRVTTVGADSVVSTKDVAIGADSVSTMSLDGATSVWVTPQSGSVQAAVLTQVTDASGVMLSVTALPDLSLTSTPSPLLQLRD